MELEQLNNVVYLTSSCSVLIISLTNRQAKKKTYDVDAEKAAAREATTFLHAILRVSNEFIRKIHFTPKNYDWSCGNGKKKSVTRCFTTS